MEDLDQYLADHHGVISLAQARRFGLSEGQIRYRLATNRLVRVAPRVFRLSTAPPTWHARARAMALSARGLIGITSALRVWEVDGHLNRTKLHVVVAGTRRPRTNSVVIHRVDDLADLEGQLINGVPVTGLARAIIDSAALLSIGQLEATIDAVIRQRLGGIEELGAELERIGTRGRKGAGRLKRLLDDRDAATRVPDSSFNRLVGRLLIDAGLPTPVYEFEVRRVGKLIGRADLAYPNEYLLIECDSERWHHNRRSFVADPRRKNRLLVAGYRVLTFTWDDYRSHPEELVAIVHSALTQRLDGLG